ncbi:hypothetical protein ACFYZN_22750 [Streptomyces sp. NPDC001777]|uniref:hypothetical protein n=1 Tax=Streptomyces sp. NPDC001777 TaxID=3364608 RepID=UPI00368D906F
MSMDQGAFGSETIHTGAVLPSDGEQLFPAVETLLAGTSSAVPGRDGWLADNIPLLSRGDAWILPFFWHPLGADTGAEERRDLDERSGRLWSAIGSWCWYHQGDPIGIGLPPAADSDLPVEYAQELWRTGARRADWWQFDDRAVVRVVHGEPIPAPITAMAVHVVPVSWAWYNRGPGAKGIWSVKEMPPTDLGWSWADVVELAGREDTSAPDGVRRTDVHGDRRRK